MVAYYGYPQYDAQFLISTCNEKVSDSFDLIWKRKVKIYYVEKSFKENEDEWADGPPPEDPNEDDPDFDFNFPF